MEPMQVNDLTKSNDHVHDISLNGNDWQLVATNDGTWFPTDDLDWIPATVPGNIQSDLEAAHRLKPLWYGPGDERLIEVMQQFWWYRKSLFVPAYLAGRRLTLAFGGVDFSCTVWLNGIEIGNHAGMFRPFNLDISRHVRFDADNELRLRIDPVPPELVDYLTESDKAMSGGGPGYPTDLAPHFFVHGIDRMRQILHDLKSPTNFGWDWGVNIYTLGIWRDVRLEVTGDARIESTRVVSTLNEDHSQATLQIELEVDCQRPMMGTLAGVVTGPGNAELARAVSLQEGEQQLAVSLILDNPELWWPNGHGHQPLYTLTVNLIDSNSGQTMAQRTTRFGIREVDWQQVQGAPPDFINPYRLVINGRPIRMIGSNIIPPDLLFGRMNERGLHLIELARHAGLNTLRVWGGGALLTDDMYDLADAYGIMLSQEFPLANCSPESDPIFLGNLQQTAGAIVKRLRNHPGIIEWSGGNEMNWRQGEDHPALHVLEQVTTELDGRLFRATCPIQGSRHSPWNYDPESHYSHYDNQALTDNIGDSQLMRYGEFGSATPAHLETWLREIPPADRWPADDEANPVLIRKNVVRAVFGDDYWLQKSNIDRLFGPINDLKTLIVAGQFAGAHGLRYAVDALRRRGDRLGGLTTWDYNEPWPNGAGSYLVDYDGRPLMSYAFMEQAVAPLALSLQYQSNLYKAADGFKSSVWLVSDAPDATAGLQWEWLATDSQGRRLAGGHGTSNILPQQALVVDRIAIAPTDDASRLILVETRLRDAANRILAERVEIIGSHKSDSPLSGILPGATGEEAVRPTKLSVRAAATNDGGLTLQVTNNGVMTALFVEARPLIVYRTDLLIDNQYVCIPPGEMRTLTIKRSLFSTQALALTQTGWRVVSWNAPEVIVAPDATVVLAIGRQDAMCQEFDTRPKVTKSLVMGESPDPADIPYLVSENGSELELQFQASAEAAGHAARLTIYTADQAPESPTGVTVWVNDAVFSAEHGPGLGVQDADPAHLAFPATIALELPAGILIEGSNIVRIAAINGWFTLDSICLVTLPGS